MPPDGGIYFGTLRSDDHGTIFFRVAPSLGIEAHPIPLARLFHIPHVFTRSEANCTSAMICQPNLHASWGFSAKSTVNLLPGDKLHVIVNCSSFLTRLTSPWPTYSTTYVTNDTGVRGGCGNANQFSVQHGSSSNISSKPRNLTASLRW